MWDGGYHAAVEPPSGARRRSDAKRGDGRESSRRRLALLDVSRTAGLGLHLRRVRTEKGPDVDRLASLSELTRGYISLVERGLKVPSIAWRCCGLPRRSMSAWRICSIRIRRRLLVTRSIVSGNREPFRPVTAPSVCRRSPPARPQSRPFLLKPPHKSAPRASHAGEEMLFVVSGQIVIKLDGEDIVMDKGDCLYFLARRRMRFAASGDRRLKSL